jgi:hypothetical protein
MKTVILLPAAFALLATATGSGPEKITFPLYQSHTLVRIVDRDDIKEVREIFANPESIKAARAGEALPSGTTLTMVHFKARVSEKGELLRDPNGRLVKGDVDRIGVMEKRTGWGAEYPEEIRNGEWEYALFKPDGSRNETANVKACFQCHKPKSAQDFVFSFPELKAPR